MDFINANNIEYFFLVFIRVFTIIIFLPVIGYEGVDIRVRALFSFLTAIICFPLATFTAAPINGSLQIFIAYAANEVLIGVIIGFIPLFIFAGFEFAGEFMGMQMGLSMMSYFDPTSGANISTISRLKYITLMLIFLMVGGHIFFIEAITKSFDVIRLGEPSYSGFAGIIQIILSNLKEIYIIGIKAGAPVVVSLFVIEVGLGLISKTIPQMNIFLVGIPLKILVGLIILVVVIGYIISLFTDYVGRLQGDMLDVINLLKSAKK